jgi:hypothetical protein
MSDITQHIHFLSQDRQEKDNSVIMLAVKQNKKRGREETNDTESFKSMFF